MRGLLYKDIVANKINVVCMGIVMLYLTFSMCIMIWDSNTNVSANEDAMLIYITLLFGVFALNFSFPAFGIDCSFGDVRTKWSTYAMALPGGYRRMVLEKYLIGVIFHGLAIVCSLIMIFICKIVYGDDFDIKLPVMCMLVMTGIMLIVQAIAMPLILKSHAGAARVLFCVIVILAFYGALAYLAFGDISFFHEGDALFRIIMWIACNEKKMWMLCWGIAGAGAVFEVISYYLTTRTFLNN